ncbi:ShlB/FhaC/HecB family hemolysin secretion/activation protein [Sphingomonas sp. TREG-RG-20F-R18-01]|uniref:ShlB/FhaC/HecB family hemolysin secretion/activation protein n=1 Tax=Sphingomonas sp. TREG-RG-20F-R18-01 TaxID=2914982 RepID=UPI001F5A6AFF|nr:ShlB/FhaC/HecB family hemolysin secretion/activation protein [Sphingomonas sp. TREG-RG-20F-R18-01]
MRVVKGVLACSAAALCPWSAAQAQDHLNRADPSIIERSLPRPVEAAPAASGLVTAAPLAAEPETRVPRVANAIVIDGASELARSRFSQAIVGYIGRDLAGADLKNLSHAVADVARQAGYPFASAWVEPQTMAAGLLRVHLDLGTLSAVRVIGQLNLRADRILTRTLVTGRAVRREQLERAILLVGDLPGVTVKESRYVRQDGFGILLVTIAEDRLTAYAQVDNRGSKEVGPIRSTIVANARGLFQADDEASVIFANTPIDPSEFIFVRGRYTAPVDANGATLSVSASYGHAKPGASLAPLDVTGESYDASIFYSKPILRERGRSLWGTLEFRGIRSSQTLLSFPLRDDHLATVTASLNGTMQAGSGVLRGELHVTDGLPLPGVTHEGDPRISRSDGDGRFVMLSYAAEWTAPLSGRVSVALASEGQIASRPLLATMEIGVGGPGFGRSYDYAERTGDDGILASGEIRFDLGRVIPHVIDRVQLYGSLDGGYVSNLRDGRGGGALVSTAAGVRVGRGKVSGMIEVAVPLNADRFDTGNRDPRVSFRLSRVF